MGTPLAFILKGDMNKGNLDELLTLWLTAVRQPTPQRCHKPGLGPLLRQRTAGHLAFHVFSLSGAHPTTTAVLWSCVMRKVKDGLPPPIPAPSEWIYLNCYTLNAFLLGLIKGRRKRRFFKSEAHYLFKLKRKITKILLHEFVYVEKTVFKSQRKSQVKKQDKYLRFQSRALVLFYKVIFPFSAYTPLRLLLLWVGRRHMHLNRDLKRPLQSTL